MKYDWLKKIWPFKPRINSFEKSFQHSTDLLLRKKYLRALSGFDRLVDQDPNYRVYVNRAVTLYYLGHYQRALQDFKMAVRLDSQSHEAYQGLGMVNLRLGRFSEAIWHYKKAISLKNRPDVNLLRMQFNLGYCRMKVDNYQDALENFNEVLEVCPEYPMARKHQELSLERSRKSQLDALAPGLNLSLKKYLGQKN